MCPRGVGTNRCRFPLTYPNPRQKTETPSPTLLLSLPASLPAPAYRISSSLPLFLSLYLDLTLSSSLRAPSAVLPPSPLGPCYSLINFPLLLHYTGVSPSPRGPSFAPYFRDRAGATTRRQSGWRHNRSRVAIYSSGVLCAPAICSSMRRTNPREA